ncbi:MAG: hypothetical protein EPO26_15340 [Chloroflexota bacterium]|nr:MAG: hypothetical protein EPO26_15340 [Chloroflexota bacterium]
MYRRILEELKHRDVISTLNAPTGDYAEHLVKIALSASKAHNSKKAWDLFDPAKRRIQVKARLPRNLTSRAELQLPYIRSFDFDDLVIVLFTADYKVHRCVRVTSEIARDHSTLYSHVNGYRLFADDNLLEKGDDITEAVRTAALSEAVR